MKKDNKSDYTINFTRKSLTFLAKHPSLSEPEAVKHVIIQLDSSDGYKRNLCIAYNKYCKFYKTEWTMPRYHPEAKNISFQQIVTASPPGHRTYNSLDPTPSARCHKRYGMA